MLSIAPCTRADGVQKQDLLPTGLEDTNMTKKITLFAMLLCCVLLFSACQTNSNPYTPLNAGQNVFGDTQNGGTQQQAVTTDQPQTNEPNYDDGTYDPSKEEDHGDDTNMVAGNQQQATDPAAGLVSYAGATPVVIDPIDKPTPTPLPPLTFTYQVYDATNLRLSFEAPVGWSVDNAQGDTFVLTNPARGVDYQAQIVVRAVSVDTQYDKGGLKQVIEGMLDTVGENGFVKYSPSNTAERTLMDNTGIYANYTGTLQNGAEVAGRVHATCINKVLYTVHISYPKGYTETYKDNVYAQLRKTIKITQ